LKDAEKNFESVGKNIENAFKDFFTKPEEFLGKIFGCGTPKRCGKQTDIHVHQEV